MLADIQELCAWAREAGALARPYFQNVRAQRKADNSWVTEADIAVERWLVERLRARYPSYGLIGEEQSRHGLESELVWAIDPIDGTASFVAGLPIWGVSIGLLRAGQPVLGAFYMPIPDELYWCEPGAGAYCNGARISVAPARSWDAEDWISGPSNMHRRYRVSFPGKVRILGSSVADLCFAARGASLGALLSRCAIWDLAAGLAILREAGGSYVGLSGAMPDLAHMVASASPLPEPLLAASPAHLEQLRSHIAQAGDWS